MQDGLRPQVNCSPLGKAASYRSAWAIACDLSPERHYRFEYEWHSETPSNNGQQKPERAKLPVDHGAYQQNQEGNQEELRH
jgi:hypothetical protein